MMHLVSRVETAFRRETFGALFALLPMPLIIAAAATQAQATKFLGLVDLPGGFFDVQDLAVSANGSVVVGQSHSASGFEVVRWTSSTGMVALGDLAGGSFYSGASGISADGSV